MASYPDRGTAGPSSLSADSFRSGELTTSDFENGSDEIVRAFKTNNYDGEIGTDLVFKNDRVRLWHRTLQPGETMPVHRHAFIYFWTAIMPGRFLQRTDDGTTCASDFQADFSHFYDGGWNEFALHNLENVGTMMMIFCAVELKKESRNSPLPV